MSFKTVKSLGDVATKHEQCSADVVRLAKVGSRGVTLKGAVSTLEEGLKRARNWRASASALFASTEASLQRAAKLRDDAEDEFLSAQEEVGSVFALS